MSRSVDCIISLTEVELDFAKDAILRKSVVRVPSAHWSSQKHVVAPFPIVHLEIVL